MKDKIINALIYTLSLTLVILILIYQNNLKYIFIIFSIYSLLLGLCYLFKKNNTSLLLIAIGISGVSSYLLYYYKILNFYNTYTFMFALTLDLILIFTLIKMIIDRILIKKIYTIKVTAHVIDLIKNPNSKKEYYKPIYEYEIDKKIYEVEYPIYKKRFIPKINDTITLLIDEKDKQETYFLPEKKEDIFNFSTTIFLIITCLIIIISLF